MASQGAGNNGVDFYNDLEFTSQGIPGRGRRHERDHERGEERALLVREPKVWRELENS